jgi:hypothetical protein
MIPTANAEPERYKGRPLVLVLENYVLDCIGELSPENRERVADVVQKAFGGDHDWKQTIRRQLRIADALDESLRQMWAQNQQIARENQFDLLPVQFAKMVVDKNFAHQIGAPPEAGPPEAGPPE